MSEVSRESFQEANVTDGGTVWWAHFLSETEHWAFLVVVIALALEFAAVKFGAPYKEKIESAKDMRIAQLNAETARLNWQIEQEAQKRAPRHLTDEQIAVLVSNLRGKLHEINIVVQKDAEAKAFEFQLLTALSQAQVKIHPFELPAGEILTLSQGVIMYSPMGASEEALKDDPLYGALKSANLFGGLTARPLLSFDVSQHIEQALKKGIALPTDLLDLVPQLPRDIHVLYVGQKQPF